MKNYKAPQIALINITPGISFAAYSCAPTVIDVLVGDECKVNPQIDVYFGQEEQFQCWDSPEQPMSEV